jgi:hypothetical protein
MYLDAVLPVGLELLLLPVQAIHFLLELLEPLLALLWCRAVPRFLNWNQSLKSWFLISEEIPAF